MKKYRLAILASHPIQYQAPFYKELAKYSEIDLKVFYCSDLGLRSYKDKEFGKEIKWDIPLLDGYDSEFLQNISPIPDLSTFFGLINPGIITKLRREKYDAVLVHGWAVLTNLFISISSFYHRVPIILRSETNLLSKMPLWKKSFKYLVLRSLFKSVSAFLAIGTLNKEFYKSYGVPEEKIFLAPYTVNNEFFGLKAKELIPKKNLLKQELGIPLSIPVVLFSGKLVDRKCPMDLLRAFEVVIKDINAALVFVGEGLLRNNLENYTKEKGIKNVYFTGFKNQNEISNYYVIADVLVLPSSFEPWGLVVNEAMCFGLPIIVSDQVGAGADLVKDNVNGFVYECGNITMLTDKLRQLLTNNDLRQKMREASLKLVNRWSYKENIEGIISCLKMIKILKG